MNYIIIIYFTFIFVNAIIKNEIDKGEKIMQEIFEIIMLICFGLSWPISVYKRLKSKSTKGKSIVFIIAILIGYIAGITGKIIGNCINYVLIMYIINIFMVGIDLILYFVNKRNELNAC